MMTIRIIKLLRLLRLNRVLGRLLRPFCHERVDCSPAAVERSLAALSAVSPDRGASALCHNELDADPAYDLQIVIPAYCVEGYIEECLDSILQQQTSYRYWICVVNDGSTDGTRARLARYETRPEITIIDQENRGFSGARNRGLERIRARYVMFVDSDDRLDSTDAIQRLMDTATRTGADIVEGGYRLFYGRTTLQRFQRPDAVGERLPLYGFPWGKVYRASLWQDVHFPERYWFEDTVNAFLIFPRARRVASVALSVYAYRKNMKGISVTSHGDKRNLDSLWVTRRLIADCLQLGAMTPQHALACLLGQYRVNQRRIETTGDTPLYRHVFVACRAIVEGCLPDYIHLAQSAADRQMVQALASGDYAAFRLTALLD